MPENKIDIKELFLGLQKQMEAQLKTNSASIKHPVSKGDSYEDVWINWLIEYLPNRYGVSNGFVVDSNGNISDQIDLIIYDHQYTPFIFNQNKARYIPAEGVYAVFEIKPDIKGSVKHNKGSISYIEYAGRKIESVRKLTRTTTNIVDRGETKPARSLTKIIGGFLSNGNSYVNYKTIEKHLSSLTGLKGIDMGCMVENGSFFVDYDGEENSTIIDPNNRIIDYYKNRRIRNYSFSPTDKSLVSFFLQLSRYLQQSIGTVAAIDFEAYVNRLDLKFDKRI